MGRLELARGRVDEAIAVMKEVAAWGRARGFRVWRDEWLSREELITDEAGPENFYVGTVDGRTACAFILQWSDREYWPDAPEHEAAYLHKLCVRREFAHQNMTGRVIEAVKEECRRRGMNYIRLDTGFDEPVVRDIYQNAGFQVVKTLELGGWPSMLLYEMEV